MLFETKLYVFLLIVKKKWFGVMERKNEIVMVNRMLSELQGYIY